MQRQGGSRTKKRRGPGGIDAPTAHDLPPQPVNWRKIDRHLMEAYHVSPQELDDWTLSEIAVGLESLEEMAKANNMSDDEILAKIREIGRKTNRQKLIEAKHAG